MQMEGEVEITLRRLKYQDTKLGLVVDDRSQAVPTIIAARSVNHKKFNNLSQIVPYLVRLFWVGVFARRNEALAGSPNAKTPPTEASGALCKPYRKSMLTPATG